MCSRLLCLLLVASSAFATLPNKKFGDSKDSLRENTLIDKEDFLPFRGTKGYAEALKLSELDLVWPLNDKAQTIHRRIGLPLLGFIDEERGYVNAHGGVDVARSSERGDDRVLAPFDGFAIGKNRTRFVDELEILTDEEIDRAAKDSGEDPKKLRAFYHSQFYEFEITFFDPKSHALILAPCAASPLRRVVA